MKRPLNLLNCLLVSMFFLVIVSCKKEAANKNTTDQSKLALDSNFVTADEAVLAASAASTDEATQQVFSHKTAVNSTTTTVSRKVLETFAIPADNPSYYINNYVGGGYAIIAADKRVAPVLAISDEGRFEKSGEIAPGLLNWLSVSHQKMQQVRGNKSLKRLTVVSHQWRNLIGAPRSSSGGKVSVDKLAPPPPTCEDSYTSRTVGPWLQTAWGQGYPYNALCPTGTYSGGHVPSGCVATSMAQILYYWKFGTAYNWSIMPLDYGVAGTAGSNELARLMHDIGLNTGMHYADSGSGSSAKCGTVLRNTYHYASASDADYNYMTVQGNIDSHWPVLLSGSTDKSTFLFWSSYSGGHQWVADGYMEGTYVICPTQYEPGTGGSTLYYHMNWGWNETWNQPNASNGYYGFNNWVVLNGTTTENFQYAQAMTYNIHPQ